MADQEGEQQNVKVMVRVRPFNSRELDISKKKGESYPDCVIQMRDNTCVVVEHYRDEKGFRQQREREAFQFDECFWSLKPGTVETTKPFADQKFVYERSGLIALKGALDGFNSCIFAYGQTGSGKTHSMLGNDADPGIAPRLCDDLFKKAESDSFANPTKKFTIECAFMEIYNEKVRDLFNKQSAPGAYAAPRIRQHPTRGIYVDGLLTKECKTSGEIKELLEKGTSERAMAETKMNKTSSRSHAIFQVMITQSDALKGTQTLSTLNLVDLAGSEKVRDSGVTGDAFTEATKINLSLSTLRKVIDVLIDNSTSKKKKVPPFRESVLTYVLSDSLGGNSKTQMMTAVSPHEVNLEDTMNTLRYALRAKAIVNVARVNEEKNAAMMDLMRDELIKLRESLATGGPGSGSAVAGGGGGGGGRPMMPEEIKREIAIREEEMKKMEEKEKEMTEMLEEQKKKEEEMNKQLEEVEEQRQELNLQMKSQRQERFALAFRNAFKITKDKKEIEHTNKELEESKEKNQYYERRIEILEEALASRNEELENLENKHGSLQDNLSRLKDNSTQEIAQLQQLVSDSEADRHTMQADLDHTRRENDRMRDQGVATQQRFEKMQMAASSSARRVELASAEKSKIQQLYEDELKQRDQKIAEALKGKEKYKSMLMEEQARSATLRQAKEEYEQRHNELQDTIRALHALVRDRESLVEHLQRSLEEAQDRCVDAKNREEQRGAEVGALRETVDEYGKASLQWMAEHRGMEREVLQLRLQLGSPILPMTKRSSASTYNNNNNANNLSSSGLRLTGGGGGATSSSYGGFNNALSPINAVSQEQRAKMFQTATPDGALSRMMMENEGHIPPLGMTSPINNNNNSNLQPNAAVLNNNSSLRRSDNNGATPGSAVRSRFVNSNGNTSQGVRKATTPVASASIYNTNQPTYFVVGGGRNNGSMNAGGSQSPTRGGSPRRWKPPGPSEYL